MRVASAVKAVSAKRVGLLSPGQVLSNHIKRELGSAAKNIKSMSNGQVVFNFDSAPGGRAFGLAGSSSRGLSPTYLAVIQGGLVTVAQIPSSARNLVLKGLQLAHQHIQTMGGEASSIQAKLNPPQGHDAAGQLVTRKHQWPKAAQIEPLRQVGGNDTSRKITARFPDAKIDQVLANGSVVFTMTDPQPGADEQVTYLAYANGGRIKPFVLGHEGPQLRDQLKVLRLGIQLGGVAVSDGGGNGLMTISEKLNS